MGSGSDWRPPYSGIAHHQQNTLEQFSLLTLLISGDRNRDKDRDKNKDRYPDELYPNRYPSPDGRPPYDRYPGSADGGK